MIFHNFKLIILSIILGTLTLIYNVKNTFKENDIYVHNIKLLFINIHFNIFIHTLHTYL